MTSNARQQQRRLQCGNQRPPSYCSDRTSATSQPSCKRCLKKNVNNILDALRGLRSHGAERHRSRFLEATFAAGLLSLPTSCLNTTKPVFRNHSRFVDPAARHCRSWSAQSVKDDVLRFIEAPFVGGRLEGKQRPA